MSCNEKGHTDGQLCAAVYVFFFHTEMDNKYMSAPGVRSQQKISEGGQYVSTFFKLTVPVPKAAEL